MQSQIIISTNDPEIAEAYGLQESVLATPPRDLPNVLLRKLPGMTAHESERLEDDSDTSSGSDMDSSDQNDKKGCNDSFDEIPGQWKAPRIPEEVKPSAIGTYYVIMLKERFLLCSFRKAKRRQELFHLLTKVAHPRSGSIWQEMLADSSTAECHMGSQV